MASSSKRSLPCVLLLLLAVFHHGCSSARAHRRAGDMEGSMSTDDSSMIERFQRWKAAYNKSYATVAEERRRFRVYARNMAYIEATNAEAEAAGLTYELGETAYTDLTNQEFMAMYTAPAPAQLPADESVITTRAGPVDAVGGAPGQLPVYVNLSTSAPASVDWRASGAVTPLKNQGRCGTHNP
jgi:C1A family cysteine protease